MICFLLRAVGALCLAAAVSGTLSVDTSQRYARLFALHSAADTSMTLRVCGHSAYATSTTNMDAWEEVDPLDSTSTGSEYVSLRPADPAYLGQYLCLGTNAGIFVNFPSNIYQNDGSKISLSMCVWKKVAGLSNSNYVSYQLGTYYLAQKVSTTQSGDCQGVYEGYSVMGLSSTAESAWPYATWLQTDASVTMFSATVTVNTSSATVWMHTCSQTYQNIMKDSTSSIATKLLTYGYVYERALDTTSNFSFSLRPYAMPSSGYISHYMCNVDTALQLVSHPSSAANCTFVHELSGSSTYIKHLGTGLYLGWGTSKAQGGCNLTAPEGDLVLVSQGSAISSWNMTHVIRMPVSSSITVTALPLATFSSMFHGLTLEDVNFEVDGGLYAELIHNRDFEVQGRGKIYPDGVGDKTITKVATPTDIRPWTVTIVSGDGNATTDSSTQPFSTNPMTLKISSVSGSVVLLLNPGYSKIWCKKGLTYSGTLYVSTDTLSPVSFSASLIDSTTKAATTSVGTFTAYGSSWQQVSFSFTGSSNNPSTIFSLSITLSANSVIWIDHISLFPGDAVKGLWRKDLYDFIAGIKPKFIRFPGGLSMLGDSFNGTWNWKNSVGQKEARPGHYGDFWTYWTTDGMGLYEYLLLCESLNATPIMTGFTGLKTDRLSYLPMTTRYATDIINALTFANGATSTTYGALRSSMGHSESFNLTWVAIGWEEQNLTEYHIRYDEISEAILLAYPSTQLLASGYWMRSGSYPFGVNPCGNGSVCVAKDDHWQMTPDDMADAVSKYDTDNYARTNPDVIVGRFSASSDSFHAVKSGLAETVFFMGLQNNADIVLGSVPNGPLFANRPNGINSGVNYNYVWAGFNSSVVYGGCSYQMIKAILDNNCIRSIRSTSTGDIIQSVCRSLGSVIIQMVNYGDYPTSAVISMSGWSNMSTTGRLTVIAPQSPYIANDLWGPKFVSPVSSTVYISENFTILLPAWSFSLLRMEGLVPLTLPCQGKTCSKCLAESQCVWCKAEKSCISSDEEFLVLASSTCQSTTQWQVSCPGSSETTKIAIAASVVGFFFVVLVVGSGYGCFYCRTRGRKDPKPLNCPMESVSGVVSFKGLTPEEANGSITTPVYGSASAAYSGNGPPQTNLDGDAQFVPVDSNRPVVVSGGSNCAAPGPIFYMPPGLQVADVAAVLAAQQLAAAAAASGSSSGQEVYSGQQQQATVYSGPQGQLVLSGPQGQLVYPGQQLVYSGPQGQQQLVFSGQQGQQQLVYSGHHDVYSGQAQQAAYPQGTTTPQ